MRNPADGVGGIACRGLLKLAAGSARLVVVVVVRSAAARSAWGQ
jgi:hypothetical protein